MNVTYLDKPEKASSVEKEAVSPQGEEECAAEQQAELDPNALVTPLEVEVPGSDADAA